MTEKRREYMREWQRKNKDKVKQYKLNTARRKALQDIAEGKVELVNVLRLKSEGGDV